MTKIEENYKGWLKWKPGAVQHIHTKKGEKFMDVVQYMRDHLKYFGFDKELTFYENEISHVSHNEYLVPLRSVSEPLGNVIRPGIGPELDAASKK